MGNQIEILRENLQKTQLDYLTKINIPYIQDCYGNFSLLNFSFFADKEEFEFIFEKEQEILFSVFEKEIQGKVDVLEILCALILFSDSQLKDKVRFLFEIFDLNEKHYLQRDETEFLIFKCSNSLYKVFNINQKLEQPLIEQFVNQHIESPIEKIHYRRLFDLIVNNQQFDKLYQKLIQSKINN